MVRDSICSIVPSSRILSFSASDRPWYLMVGQMAHIAHMRMRPIINNLGVSLLFIKCYNYSLKKAGEYTFLPFWRAMDILFILDITNTTIESLLKTIPQISLFLKSPSRILLSKEIEQIQFHQFPWRLFHH